MSNFWARFFHVFKSKFFLNYFYKYCSILTKNLHKSLLYVYIFSLFSLFFSFKIGCPRDLNPACKTRETLRQVLFYLFCVTFMEPFLNRNAFLLRFWEHFSLLKIWKRLLSHRILRGFQNYGPQIYVIYVATWFSDKVQLFWEGHKNLRNLPYVFEV